MRLLVVLIWLCTLGVPTSAQPVPSFAGRWLLDVGASGAPVDVWGQTRATALVITTDAEVLSLNAEGGGLSAPAALQRYRLDGTATVSTDTSLGELANFVRQVRTSTAWDGAVLTLETEHVSQSTDAAGRISTRRGITSVWRLRLSQDRQRLELDRTGYRAHPPTLLHGRPYDRRDDLVYNVDHLVYLRQR